MTTRIITQRDVPTLLPMGDCIDLMERTLATLSRGDAVQPLRSILWTPERTGALGVMPGFLGEPAALGTKVISVFPGNHGTPYDSHQGVVLLYELEHGRLLAVVDATEITGIRTAAVSGAVTQALARADAGDLAILGSGTQARTHLEAMASARPLRRVRVWSRDAERARAFAQRQASLVEAEIEVVATAKDAIEQADLICTTTAASEPVLCGEWLSPGAHVNAVGACTPKARELDAAAVARSRLFTDRRESLLNEAGDFLRAREEGAVDESHVQAEVGEVFAGLHAGRESDDEITLFKSLGLAVEDLAAAHHIYRQACERGIGLEVELGGLRELPPAGP